MVDSDLARKHHTRLERPARDKHFTLLCSFVNYDRKKFYDISPWLLFRNVNYKEVSGIDTWVGES